MSVFLRNLIGENVAVLRSEADALIAFLSSLGPGFAEVIRVLQAEAPPAAAAAATSNVSSSTTVDLLSYSAETIAEQLTLIDQQFLQSIRLTE